jgi:hypothetical protein
MVTHVATGLSVLGTVPWDPVEAPIGRFAARDEPEWLTRYTGGWPLLFPNGGDACTVDGAFHGFHGEASISPWAASVSGNSVRLTRRFFSVPVEMAREFRVDDDLLIIRETVRMNGPCPIEVMWGHHAAFGSDLLADEAEITTGARRVTVDGTYDPPLNPLLPGAVGDWPESAGKNGPVDLTHPRSPMAVAAYLHDFDEPWAAIRRRDDAIAIALSWEPERFPCAWLWYELGGTAEAPWCGRGRLIGIEPNSTRTSAGLADAKARGSDLLRLSPGEELSTTLRLHVFQPFGRVTGVNANGRALMDELSRTAQEQRHKIVAN